MTNLELWLENQESADNPTLTNFKKVFPAEAVEAVNKVYSDLKDRVSHPAGTFDKAGRFYIADKIRSISKARTPSRAWPYSQMTEARTRKFIMRAWIHFDCKSLKDLENLMY